MPFESRKEQPRQKLASQFSDLLRIFAEQAGKIETIEDIAVSNNFRKFCSGIF